MTKFLEKENINLGEEILFVNSVIRGTVDGFSTNIIGKIAKTPFVENTNR